MISPHERYIANQYSDLQTAKHEGLREGIDKGINIGEQKKALGTARKMKESGVEAALIVKFTGLSEEEVRGI